MARRLDLPVVMTVPGLDVESAVVLGKELLSAAEGPKTLPPAVEKARHRLRQALQGLQASGQTQDLARFIVSLRPYVLSTLAQADDEQPESAALASLLLSPLLRWQEKPSAGPRPAERSARQSATSPSPMARISSGSPVSNDPAR